MNRKTHRNVAVRFVRTAADQELLEELDRLVMAAVEGDRQAVGAIAIAFGPVLLTEIGKVLEAAFREDAGDVLHELLLAMLEGKMVFPAIKGSALPWLKRMAREEGRKWMARKRGEWGEAG